MQVAPYISYLQTSYIAPEFKKSAEAMGCPLAVPLRRFRYKSVIGWIGIHFAIQCFKFRDPARNMYTYQYT